MSKFYKDIASAPFEYVTADGVIMKMTLVPIKNVKISNSFDISYVRGIANFFNAMMARFMYHAVYDKYGKKRPRPIAQNHIYFPADQMSEMINKCESQCYNIKNQLENLFDLDITRSSANRFRLSERVKEFLHIFTEKELYEYMKKYNITDSKDKYRMLQIYHYRVVRPSDSNWNSSEERREFSAFIKDSKHKDYNHYCNRNNETDYARIQKIELHIDLLSDKQKEQLQGIKDALKQGAIKLINGLHWKLVALQQFITGMLLKDQVIASSSNSEKNNTHSQVTDRNQTEGEMRKTHEVAATHLKEPEDEQLQDVVQIAVYWNIMARDRNMEFMFSLTDKKIQSIVTLVKSHGKAKIINTITSTGYMLLPNTLMFSSFTKDSNNPNSRFNKISRKESFDTRMNLNEEMQNRTQQHKFYLGNSEIMYDNVPTFNSKAAAKSWFKSRINNM